MLQWPIREGLLRYVHMLKDRAQIDYYVSLLCWSPQAPYIKGEAKPPKPPSILRGDGQWKFEDGE